jgi:AraC-like DNA-binding protein/quercetin dioxygenase-like cupin family protein
MILVISNPLGGAFMLDNVIMGKAKYHIEKNYIGAPLKLGEVSLVQIGQTHCTEDYTVNEHLHLNWFELTYILDGKGEIITNGSDVPIKAGDIYLSFPGDIHAIRSDKNFPIKYQFLSLWPENEEILQKIEEIMLLNMDSERRIFTDQNVEMLIETILSESLNHDEHSDSIITCALTQILHYIIRNFTGKKQQVSLNVDSAEELCYQLMTFISTHIYVMESLEELSVHFGYSYSYLSSLFSKTTGDTLINYYSMKRLDAAAIMLKENKLSVGEISELLKYSSIYTFSRAFKIRFEVSPTEFKKKETA